MKYRFCSKLVCWFKQVELIDNNRKFLFTLGYCWGYSLYIACTLWCPVSLTITNFQLGKKYIGKNTMLCRVTLTCLTSTVLRTRNYVADMSEIGERRRSVNLIHLYLNREDLAIMVWDLNGTRQKEEGTKWELCGMRLAKIWVSMNGENLARTVRDLNKMRHKEWWTKQD